MSCKRNENLPEMLKYLLSWRIQALLRMLVFPYILPPDALFAESENVLRKIN